MKSFSIQELQDPLALELAKGYEPEKEYKPLEPKLKYSECTVCPFADTGKRLEGRNHLIEGNIGKDDVPCLILVEKYKPRKVGGKWIIPNKKHTKCMHIEKVGDKYGWETPETFLQCEVLSPPKMEQRVSPQVTGLLSIYGTAKIGTSDGVKYGYTSPLFLKKNPSYAKYLEEVKVNGKE